MQAALLLVALARHLEDVAVEEHPRAAARGRRVNAGDSVAPADEEFPWRRRNEVSGFPRHISHLDRPPIALHDRPHPRSTVHGSAAGGWAAAAVRVADAIFHRPNARTKSGASPALIRSSRCWSMKPV